MKICNFHICSAHAQIPQNSPELIFLPTKTLRPLWAGRIFILMCAFLSILCWIPDPWISRLPDFQIANIPDLEIPRSPHFQIFGRRRHRVNTQIPVDPSINAPSEQLCCKEPWLQQHTPPKMDCSQGSPSAQNGTWIKITKQPSWFVGNMPLKHTLSLCPTNYDPSTFLAGYICCWQMFIFQTPLDLGSRDLCHLSFLFKIFCRRLHLRKICDPNLSPHSTLAAIARSPC